MEPTRTEGITITRGVAWLVGTALAVIFFVVGNVVPIHLAETREAVARSEERGSAKATDIEDLQRSVEKLLRWGPEGGERYSAGMAAAYQIEHAQRHAEAEKAILEGLASVRERLAGLERSWKSTCGLEPGA